MDTTMSARQYGREGDLEAMRSLLLTEKRSRFAVHGGDTGADGGEAICDDFAGLGPGTL